MMPKDMTPKDMATEDATPKDMAPEDMTPGIDPDKPAAISNKALKNIPFSMVLSDPNLPDNPLTFVNDAFVARTGYSYEEAVGRNCRFLQGPDTDQRHVQALRDALADGREHAVDILNYRKDGSSFMNRLLITPIFAEDDDTRIVSFLGIQTAEVDSMTDSMRADELRTRIQELQHRVKNHLAMVLGLVRIDMRRNTPDQVVINLTRRVAGLGELYNQLASTEAGKTGETVPLGAYLSRICATTQDLTDPGHIIVNVDLDAVDVRGETASRIGMFVSEVLNNALQHAFDEEEGGEAKVSLHAKPDALHVVVEDTGRGLGDSDWPNSGSLGGRIVRDMSRILGGELSVSNGDDGAGTRVSLVIGNEHL